MSNDGTIPKKSKLTVANVKYQFLASVCANIVILAHGCTVGWVSPSLLVLMSDDSPLASGKLTFEEAGWIGSGLSIGGVVGVLLFGVVSVFIGNKRSMLLCALPILTFWSIVIFAQYPWHLSVGRLITGLTGGAFICFQFFISEIADPRVRGALSSLLTVKFNLGVLLGYIAGTHLQWYTQCYVMMVGPVIFFVLFSFFPESPQYFLKVGQIENAERSLRFYRNCKVGSDNDLELQIELEKFKEIAERNKSEERVTLKDFLKPESLRAMSIAPTLMAVGQFSGTFTLISYAGTIFKESGSNLNPNNSSMVLGILQLLGTISTYFLIDRIGRRALLALSTGGGAVGLTIMGIYCYLAKHRPDIDMSQFNWVPVVALSFVIYIASIGITPVQYIIISEVLPQKIKSIGGPLCMCTVGIFAAIMLKIFPSMLAALDLYGCMFVFALVNVIGILFIKFIVPETKGRNLDVLEGPENQTYITRL